MIALSSSGVQLQLARAGRRQMGLVSITVDLSCVTIVIEREAEFPYGFVFVKQEVIFDCYHDSGMQIVHCGLPIPACCKGDLFQFYENSTGNLSKTHYDRWSQ
jgi:hypothetical protein